MSKLRPVSDRGMRARGNRNKRSMTKLAISIEDHLADIPVNKQKIFLSRVASRMNVLGYITDSAVQEIKESL